MKPKLIQIKKYRRKECLVCGCITNNYNKFTFEDSVELFNEYGILLDYRDIRMCCKDECVDEGFEILDGLHTQKYFVQCSYNKWVNELHSFLNCKKISKILTKYVYNASSKRLDEYLERNYKKMKSAYFFQACALRPKQFERLINIIMTNIDATCMYKYCIFICNSFCNKY